ncbi:MAG: hypothetical protein H6833_10465 [Planctomycetes bacterium]|nr:hypothetical protein [Planctomycetota bacterium]
MTSLIHRLAQCGFVVFTLSSACAQEPQKPEIQDRARRLLRGAVCHVDGRAWPGATVRLVCRPWPDVAALDALEVVTDEDGNFEARLLDGMRYLASAVGNFEDDGTYERTDAKTCHAGSRLVLFAARDRGMRVDVRVPDSIDLAHTRLRVHDVWPELDFAIDESRLVTLPPLADRGALLCLETPGGERLSTHSVVLTEWRRGTIHAARLRERSGEEMESVPVDAKDEDRRDAVHVETLRTHGTKVVVLLRVTSRGNPLQGATVHLGPFLSRSTAASTSDAAGMIELRPLDDVDIGGLFSMILAVRAPGHVQTIVDASYRLVSVPLGEVAVARRGPFGFDIGVQRDLDRLREKGLFDLDIPLRPAVTLRGRLVAGSKPLAGVELQLRTKSATLHSQAGTLPASYFESAWPRRATTRDDGGFEVEGLPAGEAYVLEAMVREPLPRSEGEPDAHPLVVVAHGTAESEGDDLGTVDLAAMPRTTIRFLRADGMPARDGRLLWRYADSPFTIEQTTGRLGSVTIVHAAHGLARLAYCADGQHVEKSLEFTDEAPISIRCDAPTIVRGKVLNGRGEPILGADIGATAIGSQTNRGLLSRLRDYATVQTDERGEYELAIAAETGAFEIHAWLETASAQFTAGDGYKIAAEGKTIDHDFVIPNAPAPPRSQERSQERDASGQKR